MTSLASYISDIIKFSIVTYITNKLTVNDRVTARKRINVGYEIS